MIFFCLDKKMCTKVVIKKDIAKSLSAGPSRCLCHDPHGKTRFGRAPPRHAARGQRPYPAAPIG